MTIANDLLCTDFVKIDANDTVSAFIGAIKKKGMTFALIFDGKSYLGFADKKELLRSRFDPSTTKLKHALKHVPLLSKSTKLSEIVRLLSAADTRALPVRDNDQIVGIVRAKDVVKELRNFYKNIKIIDVLKRKLVCCLEEDAIGKVIASMTRQNVDRMPVVDDNGNIVGVVSFIDILTNLLAFPQKRMRVPRASAHNEWRATGFGASNKQNLLNCPVQNVMSEICHTCDIKGTITGIIDIMSEQDLTSVIIVKENQPVGILTVKDILEFYRKRI